jgi:hypothetical protein
MARAANAFAREPAILFRHSMRVFLFASLIGRRRALAYDDNLLYVAALFHDLGLTKPYQRSQNRFEVDGANAVHTFLLKFDLPPEQIADVWRAVALHTTFGINTSMEPLTALIALGVETDLFGQHFDEICRSEREDILLEWPRGANFKETIIETFAEGMAHRPRTTFGSVNADVLERCDPNYRRANFCGLILGSNWSE